MAELGLKAHPRTIKSFFTLMDANKSGDISLGEFTQVVRASMRIAVNNQLRFANNAGSYTPRGTLLPPVGMESSDGRPAPRSPRNIVGPAPKQRTLLKPPPSLPVPAPRSIALNERSTVTLMSPHVPALAPFSRVPYERPQTVRAPPLQIPYSARSHNHDGGV